MHPIRFPPLGELTALPRLLAEFKWPISKGEKEWEWGRETRGN